MSYGESEEVSSVDENSMVEQLTPINHESNSDSESVDLVSESDIDDDENEEEDAAEIVNEIFEELHKGIYNCLVCAGEIDATCPVWSCHICYRAYDLKCIQDWAKKGSSTDSTDRSWKCPSCNGKHYKIPKQYTCWCGKVVNPQVNEFQPHSCGQSCNHKLKQCIHNCSFGCHPGPHIRQCTSLGPNMLCQCGECERQLPCTLTPYAQGWKCDNVCNDLLNCGLHYCKEQCHDGLCKECEEILHDVKCYCGRHTKDIYCDDKEIIQSVTISDYVGLFSCDETCNELLNCGNHKCEMQCHIKETEEYLNEKSYHRCPLSPEIVKTCHCGKTPLDKLAITRESCLDPIPVCDQICNKPLPCGHTCYWKCHDGEECSPCYRLVDSTCSCGSMTYSIPCTMDQQGFQSKCDHKCSALLNCRRHRCNSICCEFEQLAMQRERDRKKQLRGSAYNSSHDNEAMTIEAAHICTKDCNKLLSCGKHTCKMTCHLGPCRPCLESSSDDLVCHCGKTKLEAPVRCGSKLPPCLNQCQRETSCGHEPMPHFCHTDDVPCPRCTKTVTKECKCHRKIMVPNTLCYMEKASCNMKCDKLLSCNVHHCNKICHKEGECPSKCLQKCMKIRECGHECVQTCHGEKKCPENISCNEKVEITCECGRLKKTVMCFNTREFKELKCDDECLRVKRNKLLFEALNVGDGSSNNSSSDNLSIESSDYISQLSLIDNVYTQYTLNTYVAQKKWCSQIEDILKDMINNSTTKSYNFQPMRRPQRQFVHELCESFKLYSESQDMEPKRSVFVKVQANSAVPRLSLQETIYVLEKKRQVELAKSQHKKLILSTKLKEDEVESTAHLFNAIAIRDIFFGVTLSMIQECIVPIYKVSNAKSEPTVQYLDSSTYVFYTPDYNLKSEAAQDELMILRDLFLSELKARNLAYSCCLCKLDSSASVVYEYDTGASLKQAASPAAETTETTTAATKVEEKPEFESPWW